MGSMADSVFGFMAVRLVHLVEIRGVRDAVGVWDTLVILFDLVLATLISAMDPG